MKREFRNEKEKDSLEIRRLISQINVAPASTGFGNPSVVGHSSTHFRNNEYWDDVGVTLDEKDQHIE